MKPIIRIMRFTKLWYLSVFLIGTFITLDAYATETKQGKADAITKVSEKKSVKPKSHPRNKTYMKRKWGIEILWVRPAASGYMLEFRYKVLDPDKAASLFKRQTKPVLIHEDSGARLVVPTPAKTGALRNSNMPKKDTTYWMFFTNPAKFIKSGDMVTIEIGEYRQKHLVVE